MLLSHIKSANNTFYVENISQVSGCVTVPYQKCEQHVLRTDYIPSIWLCYCPISKVRTTRFTYRIYPKYLVVLLSHIKSVINMFYVQTISQVSGCVTVPYQKCEQYVLRTEYIPSIWLCYCPISKV